MHECTFLNLSAEDWIAVATVVLAIVTGLLAFFTFRLWNSTKDLVEGTASDARAIERAYIFVEVQLLHPLKAGDPAVENLITVRFRNHGRSPAEIVNLRGYTVLGGASEDVPQELVSGEEYEVALPPGLAIPSGSLYTDEFTARLTPEKLESIALWNAGLFVVGRMTYRDIFGRTFETGFCWHFLTHAGNEEFILTRESKLNVRT